MDGFQGCLIIKQPLRDFSHQPLEGAFVDISRYSNLPRDPAFDLVVLYLIPVVSISIHILLFKNGVQRRTYILDI